jgi:hypothetical protein
MFKGFKRKNYYICIVYFFVCSLAANFINTLEATEVGENIALNKSYRFIIEPNYWLCTDEDDDVQLTDGQFAPEDKAIWFHKETVGWMYKEPTIIIDLEEVQPISGISFRTAGGQSDVMLPRAIMVLVSDDGNDFYYAGELVSKSYESLAPKVEGYTVWNFKTCSLKTKGRYVALTIIPSGIYVFCDEIEIYKGPNEYLQIKHDVAVTDLEELKFTALFQNGVKSQMNKDILLLREKINEANVEQSLKQELLSELSGISQRVSEFEALPTKDFRAIMPMNEHHRDVYKLNSKLLRALGYPSLAMWQNSRWDPLGPMEIPPEDYFNDEPLKMGLFMVQNEYRAEVLNISNTMDNHVKINISIEGLPGGINPDYISVHQTEFVGTREGIAIADALPFATKTSLGYTIDIPAGMTRQVWFSFNSKDIVPGKHQGYVKVVLNQEVYNIPLEFEVYPFSMPDQPFLSLGVWDYTDSDTYRGLTPNNIALVIDHMKERFVDSPWSISQPEVLSYTINSNQINMEIDYSKFDQWVARWPGAKNYMVFLAVGKTFGPQRVPISADRNSDFFRLVSHWAREWAAHVGKLGLDQSQIHLLVVDEPNTLEWDEIIILWSKAIKDGAPEFKIWEDPAWTDPRQANQEMFQVCDVLSPSRAIYSVEYEISQAFYENLRQHGKMLWFYSCSGPIRHLDPYSYNLLLAWFAWSKHAVGIGFWSYVDLKSSNPWNEYISTGISYSPVYLDSNSIVDGKHAEALREAVEDYEYLYMLKNRITELKERGANSKALVAAEIFLDEIPQKVVDSSGASLWATTKDRTFVDKARKQILELLMELR